MGRDDNWLAWLPAADANGHPLGPGLVSLHWVLCECTGQRGGGHHLVRCRVNGCPAPPLYPPEHRT